MKVFENVCFQGKLESEKSEIQFGSVRSASSIDIT